MGEEATLAEAASRNGHGPRVDAGGALEQGQALASAAGGFLRGLASGGSALAGDLAVRAAKRAGIRFDADLDDRDPDFIREQLPLAWLLATLWFRGEVRGLGKIPEDRPVLLVGNHSGGNVTPDTIVFTLAFSAYFGVERAFHQLAHNLVLASPVGPFLRRFGTMVASHHHAQRALRSGAAVLVYPGGDWEVVRPSSRRNEIDFNGRKGFIRLAHSEDVEIVPVVSVGGQETAWFVTRGEGLAKALGLDRLLRLKALPLIVALPFGPSPTNNLFFIPLPAKLTIQVLDPIDLRSRFGDDPDPDEVYDHVVGVMQDSLDELAAERRFPVIG